MRKLIGGSIFIVMSMAICLIASPSDFDNGFFASGKTKTCYKASSTPYGDIRPSVIFNQWNCAVNKEDQSGRVMQLACRNTPYGFIGFYYAKTYDDCMGLVRAF